mgnify:CR=1 FL=1
MNICQTCGACCASFRVDFAREELASEGLPLDPLLEEVGKDLDPFDLICQIAFDRPPLTRRERAATLGMNPRVRHDALRTAFQRRASDLPVMVDLLNEIGSTTHHTTERISVTAEKLGSAVKHEIATKR